jgi:hypothetical protein
MYFLWLIEAKDEVEEWNDEEQDVHDQVEEIEPKCLLELKLNELLDRILVVEVDVVLDHHPSKVNLSVLSWLSVRKSYHTVKLLV